MNQDATKSAVRIVLSGRVQGLGVRPAIYRLATELEIAGNVCNSADGVTIVAEGTVDQLQTFQSSLIERLPVAAHVTSYVATMIDSANRTRFEISQDQNSDPLNIPVPVDRAICTQCWEELFNSNNRRYRYPWISCTNCGPRFSIIQQMPFEREATSYSQFKMCRDCQREYETPDDRRFHAQTISCQACGPQVWSWTSNNAPSHQGGEALLAVVQTLRKGGIVAARGVGGYQLLVDATNEDAVRRLRLRKQRKAKPFAVLVPSIHEVDRLAVLDRAAIESLSSSANPIQLLAGKTKNGIAASVNPGLLTLGIMLPTSGLHALLLNDSGFPLVCTSANLEGEPLEYEVQSAEKVLGPIADLILHHDLPIAHPIDDSVVRTIGDQNVTMRAARGLAPLHLSVSEPSSVVAVGAFQKSAIAWSTDKLTTLGPYIGNHQSVKTRERYHESYKQMLVLYRCAPGLVMHDAHPGYYSTEFAQEMGLPRQAVQHHHAHILSTLAEHQWLDEEVIGIAWDGTGYGLDGSLWGGEFFNYSSGRFTRIGSLRPFRLPGGEAAIKEPWRIAVSLLGQCEPLLEQEQIENCLHTICSEPRIGVNRLQAIRSIVESQNLSPTTTSAGRLFDGVAALLLNFNFSDYEGEAAIHLEDSAWRHIISGGVGIGDAGKNTKACWDAETMTFDWRPFIVELIRQANAGVCPDHLAFVFHQCLAEGVVDICDKHQRKRVALGGGVFQNRLLTELLEARLGRERLIRPINVPPNDNGLAVGQLVASSYSES